MYIDLKKKRKKNEMKNVTVVKIVTFNTTNFQ